ncbi:hypothetical protein BY996DRAFT_6457145 [Phakopsora pachyrhizi]|nr:hypothetical protein BY996DRAFT_6457145 [Phakopsora pachyrhizi]
MSVTKGMGLHTVYLVVYYNQAISQEKEFKKSQSSTEIDKKSFIVPQSAACKDQVLTKLINRSMRMPLRTRDFFQAELGKHPSLPSKGHAMDL